MKFQVGDVIKIRKDLHPGSEYGGLTFHVEMEQYGADPLVIKRVDPLAGYVMAQMINNEYSFEGFWYTPEMIERKVYEWEDEFTKAEGQEACQHAVEMEQEYESEKADNDCESCGWKNYGRPMRSKDCSVILLRFGCWQHGRCSFCGREDPARKDEVIV